MLIKFVSLTTVFLALQNNVSGRSCSAVQLFCLLVRSWFTWSGLFVVFILVGIECDVVNMHNKVIVQLVQLN